MSADTERGKPLFNAVIELSCKLSMEHGLSGYSANSFACFAGMISVLHFVFLSFFNFLIFLYTSLLLKQTTYELIGVLANYDQPQDCYQYVMLALKLSQKIPHAPSLSRTETNIVVFGQWYQDTMHNCKKLMLAAYKHSIENGGIQEQ